MRTTTSREIINKYSKMRISPEWQNSTYPISDLGAKSMLLVFICKLLKVQHP